MLKLRVLTQSQQLKVLDNHENVLVSYTISTALKGLGEAADSEQTPRGKHRIAEKIGANADVNTIFVGRKPTGEIYTPELAEQFPERDWILTRILWLDGLEPGKNQGDNVDSKKRYIYIHGSPDTKPFGTPCSKGCINMKNTDIIALFDRVVEGTEVEIIG
jgi:lipoprotein-anchoring transpeptidase ErfK/SrfK